MNRSDHLKEKEKLERELEIGVDRVEGKLLRAYINKTVYMEYYVLLNRCFEIQAKLLKVLMDE